MRFLFAKHHLTCKHCRAEITLGELFCKTFHENKQTGATFGFSYHYECYIEDYVERIRKSALYWRNKLTPPKKRGRPVKSTHPKIYRKLMALKRYYRKTGNTDKVRELETELESLRL